MAKSNVSKGNYHVKKSIDWLKSEGYDVVKTEIKSMFFYKDKKTGEIKKGFNKNDIWGADLMAKNQDRLVFIQVKANAAHVSEGTKELLRAGPWPKNIALEVHHWPLRRRVSEGPEITIIERDGN